MFFGVLRIARRLNAKEIKMKQLIGCVVAALFGMVVATAMPAMATTGNEGVKIQKPAPQTATKVAKKRKHYTRKRRRKHAAIPLKVAAEQNPVEHCHFLFWEVACNSVRNEDARPVAAKDEDGGIPARLPGVGAKKSGMFESNNVGVLAKAESMIGLNARRDRQTLKQELSQANHMTVDPARIPWCAAWMNMVLDQSGIKGTGSLLARSFLAWGKPVQGDPKIGDVVVMRRGRNRNQGHVGFFYAFVDHNGSKMIAVLGGNQGKEVKISYYPISKVIAYRTAG
jgi:uncharacterized protein (TIGR02594 family)